MARITTIAVALCVLATTLVSSAAAGVAQKSDGRPTGPIRVPLGPVVVRGLVHHEPSERLVVAVDDQVEIFDLQGRPTATVGDISEAMEPVEAGGYVVVGSPRAQELVVIDPVAGVVVERIPTRARGLSAIAAAGDRIWYAHGQWPDGIGVASIAEATATPSEDLGRLDVADGIEIGISASRPGRVYLTDPAGPRLRWVHRDGGRAEAGLSEPVTSFVVAERGDVVWALTPDDDIIELDAETLGPTGFRLGPPEPSGPTEDRSAGDVGLLVGHRDERLAVAVGRTVTHYDATEPTPAAAVTLAGRVVGLDLAERDLYVVVADDTRSDVGPPASDEIPLASELLIMDRDDAAPTPTLDVGFFGFGEPSSATRGTLRLTCAGRVTAIPIRYGAGLELPLPTEASTCELTVLGGPTPDRRHLSTATGTSTNAALDPGTGSRTSAESVTVPISGIAGNDRIDLVDTYPSVATDPAILTGQIFRDLLGRAPTGAEHRSWATALANGTGPGALTAGLIDGPDFQTQIAPVSRFYQAYLGRQADDAGLAYWLARIRAGTTIDEVSWAFGASAEFGGAEGTDLSDAQFVELLYQRVLGRTAEPEGAAYWTGVLAGGASRSLIVNTFADSPEFARRTGPTMAVRWLYRGLLRRDPDLAAGLYWRAVAQGGGSLTGLADQILESPEYEQRFWLRDPLSPAGSTADVDGARLGARPNPGWSGPEPFPMDRH